MVMEASHRHGVRRVTYSLTVYRPYDGRYELEEISSAGQNYRLDCRNDESVLKVWTAPSSVTFMVH